MSEHTPSVNEVRADFVHEHTRRFDEYQAGRSLESEVEHYGDQFDRFLARVKRDAAREALDGLAEHIDRVASQFLGVRVGTQKAQDARDYRDTHYPEGDDQ